MASDARQGSAEASGFCASSSPPVEGHLQEHPEHALVPEPARGQAPHERAQRFHRGRVELGGGQERERQLVVETEERFLGQDTDPPAHVVGAHGLQGRHLPGRQEGGRPLLSRLLLEDEAGAGLVERRVRQQVPRGGGDERVQVGLVHDSRDAHPREEAAGHAVARQVQRRPLHLRVREGQGHAEQGFEGGGLRCPEVVTQDREHAQGVRLRPHERCLAATREEPHVEPPGTRQGGKLPDCQGHGRTDGRGEQRAQDRLTGVGLVDGRGQQTQGPGIPPGAACGQVRGQHLRQGVEQAIPVDEPLVDAGRERARSAGRPLRARGGGAV